MGGGPHHTPNQCGDQQAPKQDTHDGGGGGGGTAHAHNTNISPSKRNKTKPKSNAPPPQDDNKEDGRTTEPNKTDKPGTSSASGGGKHDSGGKHGGNRVIKDVKDVNKTDKNKNKSVNKENKPTAGGGSGSSQDKNVVETKGTKANKQTGKQTNATNQTNSADRINNNAKQDRTKETPTTNKQQQQEKEKQDKTAGKQQPQQPQQQQKKRRIRLPEATRSGCNRNNPLEASISDIQEDDSDDGGSNTTSTNAGGGGHGSSSGQYDFDSILTDEIRQQLTTENILIPLAKTPCDPERFLKPISSSQKSAGKSIKYLDREVDAKKLYEYITTYMYEYYDLSNDRDPFSEHRQALDNQLWDSMAYIIPLLCRQVVNDVLSKESLIIAISPNVLVFGDIHGNLNDIYYIHRHFISNTKYNDYRFLFLGDYVDRGPKSVEVCIYLFTCKLLDPKRIILLRGNHEVAKVNKKYGFATLVEYLFKDNHVQQLDVTPLIYQSFNRTFNYLPLAALIKSSQSDSASRIFCCHGGIPNQYLRSENGNNNANANNTHQRPWKIEELNALGVHFKPNDLVPSKRSSHEQLALNEILWNDPVPKRVRTMKKLTKLFYKNKKRGGHCSWFTEQAVCAFMEVNNLRLIIRGHQFKFSKEHGYNRDFSDRLLTVFSSSNYCGTEHNVTGYVAINDDMIARPMVLRTLQESAAYRGFNTFEIVMDEQNKQVTEVVL